MLLYYNVNIYVKTNRKKPLPRLSLFINKEAGLPIKNKQDIFKEGELEENVACRNFRHTTSHNALRAGQFHFLARGGLFLYEIISKNNKILSAV